MFQLALNARFYVGRCFRGEEGILTDSLCGFIKRENAPNTSPQKKKIPFKKRCHLTSTLEC